MLGQGDSAFALLSQHAHWDSALHALSAISINPYAFVGCLGLIMCILELNCVFVEEPLERNLSWAPSTGSRGNYFVKVYRLWSGYANSVFSNSVAL